jgi:hypothetical protein
MVFLEKNPKPEKNEKSIPENLTSIFRSVGNTLKFALVVTEEAINGFEDRIEELGGQYDLGSILVSPEGVTVTNVNEENKEKIEALNIQKEELILALPIWQKFIRLQEKGLLNTENVSEVVDSKSNIEKMFVNARRHLISGQRFLLDNFEEHPDTKDIEELKLREKKLIEQLSEVTYKLQQIDIGLTNLGDHLSKIAAT